ncbi:hypothetical protein JTE90_003615 [Oedothorax gibbosus]|uniref:Uncharacterized protein n=1 Tax=Oedothorax gibbosus TaxID=931172 RepID=A0AAV6VBP1_9ARAC|nr:hypothetical protein JTE90_003615 [Oedothorax gibbosus]
MENSKSIQRTQINRNDSFYKIYVSSSPFKTNNAQSQFFNIDSNSPQCIRCGRDMKGFQSVFVTICLPNMQPKSEKGMASNIPSFRKQSSFAGMGQRNIIDTDDVSSSDGNPISTISINIRSTDGSCPLCQNNTSFTSQPEIDYVSRIRYHSGTCNDSNDSGESSTGNIASPSSPERYPISDNVGCKFHTPVISNVESSDEILSNLSNKDQFVANESLHSTSRGIPNDRDGDIFTHPARRLENPIKTDIIKKFEIIADTSFTPCNDCHVAVVDATRPSDDDQQTVCLMFQVSNVTDITEAYLRKYECHLPSNIDVGIGVNPDVLVDNGKF